MQRVYCNRAKNHLFIVQRLKIKVYIFNEENLYHIIGNFFLLVWHYLLD